MYLTFLLALLWAGSAVFWAVWSGVPIHEQPRIWDVYYPQLRRSGALEADLRSDDGSFDVLMLGASVIDPSFGSIEAQLRDQLVRKFAGRARVFNVATSAHTTRDSLNKFEYLCEQGKHFDLVLVYDAINDVRMNNCPPGAFRNDYTHCGWYSSFERRKAAGSLTLPISEQVRTVGELISLGEDSPNLRQFGSDIRTPAAYRQNLAEIVRLARERGSEVLLVSFAWFIPEDYTFEALTAKSLDYSYAPVSCSVEMWGEPDAVRKTLNAHNAVVRDLVQEHPDIRFADVEAAIPRRGEFFIDPCHLTEVGCRRFVEAVWPQIDAAARRQ